MVQFGKVLKTRSLRSNSVTRQVNLKRTKIDGNAKTTEFKCDILSKYFSNNVMLMMQQLLSPLQCSIFIPDVTKESRPSLSGNSGNSSNSSQMTMVDVFK